jgi:hypothetical protein
MAGPDPYFKFMGFTKLPITMKTHDRIGLDDDLTDTAVGYKWQ